MPRFHENVRDISIEIHIRVTDFWVVHEYFVRGTVRENEKEEEETAHRNDKVRALPVIRPVVCL